MRLVVDGREIRQHEYVQPLLEELEQYARADPFDMAVIEHAPEEESGSERDSGRAAAWVAARV